MKASKLALFVSGLFFGGAIDHGILASLGRPVTPYGWESGVMGNWLLAGLDLVIAAGLYGFHQSQERRLS